MNYRIFLLLACFIAGLSQGVWAQTTLPEIPIFGSLQEMYGWVQKYAETSQSGGMGLLFMKLRPQITELPWDRTNAYEAGLLHHYAQNHSQSVAALESFVAAWPQKIDAEVVALLVEGYYHTGQLVKGELFRRYFHEKFPDHQETLSFGYGRRIDSVDNFLFILYCKNGRYEDAINIMHEMIARRDRDKPEQINFSSTLYNLGSNAYIALGRYDDAIEFLKQERDKFAPDDVLGQYADFHRVVTEYEKLAATGDYAGAVRHLEAQRHLFPNQYALKRYETALSHAKLRGTPMIPLAGIEPIKEVTGLDPADPKGKVVVLDFWATWCHACIEGFPHMNELMARHRDQGLVIVGITKPQGMVSGMPEMAGVKIDYEKEMELTRKLVAEYPRYRMDYPVVMDRSGASMKNYAVGFLPTIVVIDRKGVIRWVGFPVDTQFDMLIERLLSE